MKDGSCQNIPAVPQQVKEVFVVSADISAEEHVRLQAALQTFVDNSLSKTINFPETATVDDVATAYMTAWELNCKGITVYVTGSREDAVLETQATASKKASASEPSTDQIKLWQETKKPRPRSLIGAHLLCRDAPWQSFHHH
jgi:ribonucleoside-diphosphate reductase alpha chain